MTAAATTPDAVEMADDLPQSDATVKQPRKARSQKSGSSAAAAYQSHIVPVEITGNAALNADIGSMLPVNYNFEIHKTIWRIASTAAAVVALQFPEGLLMYSTIIADLLSRYTGCECVIMGDVTYGACCVDDRTAAALGATLLLHYGHSCLVPVDSTTIATLYVFVTIDIDRQHLLQSLQHNFEPQQQLVLCGTVQFTTAVQQMMKAIVAVFPHAVMPQCKPLSGGEVLGCTSMKLNIATATTDSCNNDNSSNNSNNNNSSSNSNNNTVVVFIADGRFHLESLMIHNPGIALFYKYDPYQKKLTFERYEHDAMMALRQQAIQTAKTGHHQQQQHAVTIASTTTAATTAAVTATEEAIVVSQTATDQQQQQQQHLPSSPSPSSPPVVWGLILGTLGRQGSPHILSRLESLLKTRHIAYVIVLLSEITPSKLTMMSTQPAAATAATAAAAAVGVSVWVQVACPRLSIDWGHCYQQPLLNSYEAEVALTATAWQSVYPMDYYAANGGTWTSYYHKQKAGKAAAAATAATAPSAGSTARRQARAAVTIAYESPAIVEVNC